MTAKTWTEMKPRDFDADAKDVQLSLMPEPDECGGVATLFDDEV